MNLKNIALKTVGQYLNLYAHIRPRQAAAMGLNLFCRPFAKKLKLHQKQYLKEAKFSKLEFAQTKIQTYKWGNGPKSVLLVHGWASHSYRWRTYIDALVKLNYTVYAFDAPGHGLSHGHYLTLPKYSAVIEQFTSQIGGIDAIIGHSFGGYAILYWLYAFKPSTNAKAVIMAAPGEVSDFMDQGMKQLNLSLKMQHHLHLEFKHRAGKTPEDFSSSLLAMDLIQPALIVHDRNDQDTQYQYSEKLHRAWQGSKLMLTNGLGHSLKSNEVLQTILAFLASNADK